MNIIIHEDKDSSGRVIATHSIDLRNNPNDLVVHPTDPTKRIGRLDAIAILNGNLAALQAGGWHLQTSFAPQYATAWHVLVAATQAPSATPEAKALNLAIPAGLTAATSL